MNYSFYLEFSLMFRSMLTSSSADCRAGCASNVAIGSYVNLTKDDTGVRTVSYNTRISIKGFDKTEIKKVVMIFQSSFIASANFLLTTSHYFTEILT
ncbi:hypothetical protein KXD40_001875 [Peronospora effusa]|uniref:Uncharacterized protein n=1 Tax=Peronospora effusa TaxID=542832 RepID=A0A425CDG3_9STRA|nr:hypothetical protein DD237_005159 [Peronospora effusa]UIZ26439.1 hypothetical protein KXD40_001875 [Peronospora effusa]